MGWRSGVYQLRCVSITSRLIVLAPFKLSLLSGPCSVPSCLQRFSPRFPEEPFNMCLASNLSLGRLTFPECLFHINCPLPFQPQVPRPSSKDLILWFHGPDQTPSLFGLYLLSSDTSQTDSTHSHLVLYEYLFLGKPPIRSLS